jgi:hypothetical protein
MSTFNVVVKLFDGIPTTLKTGGYVLKVGVPKSSQSPSDDLGPTIEQLKGFDVLATSPLSS